MITNKSESNNNILPTLYYIASDSSINWDFSYFKNHIYTHMCIYIYTSTYIYTHTHLKKNWKM